MFEEKAEVSKEAAAPRSQSWEKLKVQMRERHVAESLTQTLLPSAIRTLGEDMEKVDTKTFTIGNLVERENTSDAGLGKYQILNMQF